MKILGVDPGLANTGMVIVEGGRIIAAKTLKTPADGPKPKWETALLRADTMADGVEAYDLEHQPDYIVAESYKDFGGQHMRSNPNRWTTPMVCALIHSRLQVYWQDPEYTMKAMSSFISFWKSGRVGIVPGDHLLKNEHLRSAAAHALFFESSLKTRGLR